MSIWSENMKLKLRDLGKQLKDAIKSVQVDMPLKLSKVALEECMGTIRVGCAWDKVPH